MKYLKWGLIGVGVLFVLPMVIGMIVIAVSPEKRAEIAADVEKTRLEREKAEAEEVKKETAEKAEAEREKARQVANAKQAARDKQKNAVLSYYRNTMNELKPCERASNEGLEVFIKATSGKVDTFAAYGAIKGTLPSCERSTKALANLKIPSNISDKITKSLTEGKPYCFGAAETRHKNMEIMLRILDGEVKPSFVSEMEENGELVQGATLRCSAGLASAAVEAGVAPEQLK